MSELRAFRAEDIPDAAPATRTIADPVRHAQLIEVEIAQSLRRPDVIANWADLCERAATPNVFMDPGLIGAVADSDPAAQCRTLLAWKLIDGQRRLVGLWAFAVGRPHRSPLPVRVLRFPSHKLHGHLASPTIDRNFLEETLDAMLDCIAASALPKIAALNEMAADGPTFDALMRVLARRGGLSCQFDRRQRPKLASELDGKAYLEKSLSSSTRKKLRQHRRKLAETGVLSVVIASEPQAVRVALDKFLAMEALGWKGRQGTALLSNKADAAFMRGAVAALAENGRASIHSLNVDGTPVSMQIVARAGAVAFTWKTTYDEAFMDFSPGMLLLEDYTAALLADRSIAYVDSCSFDDTGYMAAWTQRQPVADLWFDARRGRSLTFRSLCCAQKLYFDLRVMAKGAYLAWRKRGGSRSRGIKR